MKIHTDPGHLLYYFGLLGMAAWLLGGAIKAFIDWLKKRRS